jgi:hypothetical protein
MAKIKAMMGFIFNSIPAVDEFIPRSAYKFRNSGMMVKNTAMITI